MSSSGHARFGRPRISMASVANGQLPALGEVTSCPGELLRRPNNNRASCCDAPGDDVEQAEVGQPRHLPHNAIVLSQFSTSFRQRCLSYFRSEDHYERQPSTGARTRAGRSLTPERSQPRLPGRYSRAGHP